MHTLETALDLLQALADLNRRHHAEFMALLERQGQELNDLTKTQ